MLVVGWYDSDHQDPDVATKIDPLCLLVSRLVTEYPVMNTAESRGGSEWLRPDLGSTPHLTER